MDQETRAAGAPCPRCAKPMEQASVKTAIWRGESLFVVEDIPAQVCEDCHEQFYDEVTTEVLRRMVEESFAGVEPVREVRATVYSLAGRIPSPPVSGLPDEDEIYADY